jgi:hypothetical protein
VPRAGAKRLYFKLSYPRESMAHRKPETLTTSELFRLDKRIRYAQIVSSDGQVLEGGMREGLVSLDPPEERATRIQQFRAKRELVDEWSSQYGKYSYSLIVFDKIKLFVFPLDEERTLFVSVASSIGRSSIERLLADFMNNSSL